MPHRHFNSSERTQAGHVVACFLSIIFILLPITTGRAEQGPDVMMKAKMIVAIEDRLAHDDLVQENLIDVVIENGIVALVGEVDNILAKERAAALTGTIKGVRSVINQILVNPSSQHEDQEIEE